MKRILTWIAATVFLIAGGAFFIADIGRGLDALEKEGIEAFGYGLTNAFSCVLAIVILFFGCSLILDVGKLLRRDESLPSYAVTSSAIVSALAALNAGVFYIIVLHSNIAGFPLKAVEVLLLLLVLIYVIIKGARLIYRIITFDDEE